MTRPVQRVHSGGPKPVPAARHNRVLRAAERRALDLEDHLVGLLVPVLEDAGDVAARNFRERASTHLSASLTQDLTASAEIASTSTMVAVKPRAAEAQALAQDGEHPPEKLHVTLAYLGRTEGPLEHVAAALARVAATHAPLEGTVGGAGVFADMGDGHPSILLPDVPGLLELRHQVTEALTGAGIDYGRDHGFTAHVTIGYRPDPNAPPVDLMGAPLHFDDLLVVRGDTEVLPLPLTGAKPITASTWENGSWALEDAHAAQVEADVAAVAEQHQPDGGYGDTYWNEGDGVVYWICADWTSNDEIDAAVAAFEAIDGVEGVEACDECGPPGDGYVRVYPSGLTAAAIDQLDFCLPLQLRGKTDPVRQAVVQSVGIAGVQGTGIAFDVTNPHAGQVLARAASQVTHIARTTQLDVMKVISAAYEDGLSIPDTAKAIQAAMKVSAPVRARLIARTELAGAVNGASLAATQIVSDATDAQYQKTWLTAPGAKYPRHDDYEGLDRQTVGLDEYFDVGGSALQFPGDPNGPPDEVCNCRCTMIYAEPGGGVGEIDAESGGLAASLCHAHDPSREFLETWFDNEVATIVWGLVAAGSTSGPADWVSPGPEEILPVGCDRPGASLTPDTHPTSSVADAAAGLLERARAAEPSTTATLQRVVADGGGELVGLDFSVKTAPSLERKIATDLEEFRVANPGITADRVAGTINDVLRYTMQFSEATYSTDVRAAIKALEADGYEAVKVKNYWEGEDYKGINAVFRTPDGQRFELQFHTAASFAAKNGDLHLLYERYRVSLDHAERARLWDEMRAITEGIATPRGSSTIGTLVTHAAPA